MPARHAPRTPSKLPKPNTSTKGPQKPRAKARPGPEHGAKVPSAGAEAKAQAEQIEVPKEKVTAPRQERAPTSQPLKTVSSAGAKEADRLEQAEPKRAPLSPVKLVFSTDAESREQDNESESEHGGGGREKTLSPSSPVEMLFGDDKDELGGAEDSLLDIRFGPLLEEDDEEEDEWSDEGVRILGHGPTSVEAKFIPGHTAEGSLQADSSSEEGNRRDQLSSLSDAENGTRVDEKSSKNRDEGVVVQPSVIIEPPSKKLVDLAVSTNDNPRIPPDLDDTIPDAGTTKIGKSAGTVDVQGVAAVTGGVSLKVTASIRQKKDLGTATGPWSERTMHVELPSKVPTAGELTCRVPGKMSTPTEPPVIDVHTTPPKPEGTNRTPHTAENLAVVLRHVETRDLRNAVLVNSAWGAAATQLLWRDVTVQGLRRILLTSPNYSENNGHQVNKDHTSSYSRQYLMVPMPSVDLSRFHATIAPHVEVLHLDTRELYEGSLLRSLLNSLGKVTLPKLQELHVSLHGYDRNQIELAMRFAVESVTRCRFTTYWHTRNITRMTGDILNIMEDRARTRMPRLNEFKFDWRSESDPETPICPPA